MDTFSTLQNRAEAQRMIPPCGFSLTHVAVEIGMDGDWRVTRLADFLRENAESIGHDEASSIRNTLARGLVYMGGGGASPVWRMCRVYTS